MTENMTQNDPEDIKTNQKEIINILKAVMEQNYSQFDQQYYRQTEQIAMGTPTSAILAEAYIQYVKQKQLYPILMKYQIIGYFRYVDNILIFYNQNKTNINETLVEFNKQSTNIKFIIEKEQHNTINFLDLHNIGMANHPRRF
jgi:hypothetical protein